MAVRKGTTYGFKQTSGLLSGQIRRASETRGFAQSRVLTHWEEIAGADIAAISRPVEVSYGRGGFGATLTLLTTGANAPLLEMRKETLRERVNAIYGYNAIARIRITQTAATGFADGRVAFEHRPAGAADTGPRPDIVAEARTATESVGDEGLRAALERLGANVITKARG
ncbi:DUF721 domain-containing protein [Salipiger sp.]|uniref:DUF721 domain-containing protein n=1 Tax=Salipiger sp. TaxID=2078585 RepID=UPI003A98782D